MKIGDKIICIDGWSKVNPWPGAVPVYGEIYTIKDIRVTLGVTSFMLEELTGLEGGWLPSRFKLVKKSAGFVID